jgi:hypothetical protein
MKKVTTILAVIAGFAFCNYSVEAQVGFGVKAVFLLRIRK